MYAEPDIAPIIKNFLTKAYVLVEEIDGSMFS